MLQDSRRYVDKHDKQSDAIFKDTKRTRTDDTNYWNGHLA